MRATSENSPIESLQRECLMVYLCIMSASLLCYIYLCWHFVSPIPFSFFIGVLLLTHIGGLLLVYRLPYSSIKNSILAIVTLSVISASPLIILSHVMGNMNTYIWLVIAPGTALAISPEATKSQRIIVCCSFVFLLASLVVISELLVGLFEKELVNWYHHLLEKDSSLKNKLSFVLPIIMGSIILCFDLHYLLRIEAMKAQLALANNYPAATGPSKEECEAEAAKFEELYKNIIHSFETDKFYLDPKFSISQLSSQLNSNVSYISRAIKLKRDMNFKTLVSIYRIEHAKEMIRQNSGTFTIEYIFTASGFANQSTFNKIFRQFEGITPRDFQEQEKENGPAC